MSKPTDTLKSVMESSEEVTDWKLMSQKLQKEIDQLKAENEDLKERLKGLSGFVVRSPNAGYSDVTAGIIFRNGTAFIPDGDGADEKMRLLRDDFGYAVEHVDDWRAIPEAPKMGKSFIDVISGR